MAHRGFRHLPVVRRNKQAWEKELLGIVSAQDLIDLMHAISSRIEARQEVITLLSELDNYVSSIMSDNPVTISSDKTMLDAIRTMGEKNVGALPIIKSEAATTAPTNPKLLGIITLRDLVSLLASYAPFGIRAEDIMTRRVITIDSNDTVHSALALMSRNRVRRLPVIDTKSESVLGMVTNKMLVRYFESSIAYSSLRNGIEASYRQPVRMIMMSPMPVLDPKEDCGTAAYMMRELGTGGFAVTDSRGLLGILTERDLIRSIHAKYGISFFSNLFSKAQTIYC